MISLPHTFVINVLLNCINTCVHWLGDFGLVDLIFFFDLLVVIGLGVMLLGLLIVVVVVGVVWFVFGLCWFFFCVYGSSHILMGLVSFLVVVLFMTFEPLTNFMRTFCNLDVFCSGF